MTKKKQQVNHLKGQTSPYLLQHLYNPVDWYPWGEEALKKARREDKPILVSIGYSACHWCHVMERESFEDEEVAEIMNREFVCIKVDREERPDIDNIYMTAVQILTKSGGWPLNCFALPDTRPFWGGTYFNREQWKSILHQVADLYKNRRPDIEEQARQLNDGVALSGFIEISGGREEFDKQDTAEVFKNVSKYMDRQDGGTRGAPKFPLPVNIDFLLHYYFHTGEPEARYLAGLTLDRMAMGGIYDQVGGGFSRYSTDSSWKVPHFEKMLYDNGQLLSIYSDGWKVFKKQLYRDVIYGTAEFVKRELTSSDGLFFAALDADSEGEEGKFYIWQENEIDEALGAGSLLIKRYYGVGKEGYWENGNNILVRSMTDEDFAGKSGLSVAGLRKKLAAANQKLLDRREQRKRPALDNKIITSWNALMIRGLADAYAALGDEVFIGPAIRAADRLLSVAVSPEGKVYRLINNGKADIEGFLDDHAHLAYALIRLYEVTGETGYLLRARDITRRVMVDFASEGTSQFNFSSLSGEELSAPYFELQDNVMPSSNSVMAHNLHYLAGYFEDHRMERHSRQMLTDLSNQVATHSISYTNWAKLVLHHAHGFYNVAVTGPDAVYQAAELNTSYLPGVKIGVSGTENEVIPLFRERYREGETWIWVCSHGRCKMPVKQISHALDQIMDA